MESPKAVDVRVEFVDPPKPLTIENDDGKCVEARTLARLIVNGQPMKVTGFPKKLSSYEKNELTRKYIKSLEGDFTVVGDRSVGPNRHQRRDSARQTRLEKRRKAKRS